MPPSDEFKIAGHGQKTIKVQINFWTDNIAPKGYIQPKHCWSLGMVTVAANPAMVFAVKSPYRSINLKTCQMPFGGRWKRRV